MEQKTGSNTRKMLYSDNVLCYMFYTILEMDFCKKSPNIWKVFIDSYSNNLNYKSVPTHCYAGRGSEETWIIVSPTHFFNWSSAINSTMCLLPFDVGSINKTLYIYIAHKPIQTKRSFFRQLLINPSPFCSHMDNKKCVTQDNIAPCAGPESRLRSGQAPPHCST